MERKESGFEKIISGYEFLRLIQKNNKISTEKMAAALGVSVRTIKRRNREAENSSEKSRISASLISGNIIPINLTVFSGS